MGSFEKNNDDYLLCRSILEEGSKTFYFASKKLPQEKRKGFWAVYAFCRKTDDIIDEGMDSMHTRKKKLNQWKQSLLRAHKGKKSQNGIIRAFTETMKKYKIPLWIPLKLIKGVGTDAKKVAFDDAFLAPLLAAQDNQRTTGDLEHAAASGVNSMVGMGRVHGLSESRRKVTGSDGTTNRCATERLKPLSSSRSMVTS